MKKWDKRKRDCRNCKHFYVCCYHKKWDVQGFLEKHLEDCMRMGNIKAQGESDEIIYRLLCKHCKYFNKDAYSNTYTWSKKDSSKTVEVKKE